MASRARTLLYAALIAIPCVAFAHNGRDAGPPKAKAAEKAAPVDIFAGIRVTTDPKTGVRSYVQVGDIPTNNGTAMPVKYDPATMGPGVDYWVQKSLDTPPPAYAAPARNFVAADTHVEMYDEGYYSDYGYGAYWPAYGYGYYGGGGRNDRPGRPGHGHGGGRPEHGNDSGVIRPPPRAPFSRYSPPAGPPGGGVGSVVPYPFDARPAGAPVRGRRG